MTLQELDEVLRVWKARLSLIAENLLELQSDAAYQSLTGTGGLDQVAITGLTAARVKPALGAMHTMFEQFGLLQSTIDQAEALRKELPAFFGGDAKAREIEQLLFGKSIQLSAVDVPLEQRTLLGGIRSEQRITPEELLAPMERTFGAARDAVMSAERAWTEFAAKSSRVEAEIARLSSQRALPSVLLAPALDDVRARLQTVRAHVQTDPLGAEGELQSQVEPALAEVSRRIDQALQIAGQLRAARVRFEQFAQIHADAVTACAEAEEKIAGAPALPALVPEEKVRGLLEWIGRLEQKREEGALEPVTVGLRNWNAATEGCVQQDRKAYEAARARVEQRSELRGRFDALKAKARRFGMAEKEGMEALCGKVEALLYNRPTDLDGAAAALAQYEKHLSGNGKGA